MPMTMIRYINISVVAKRLYFDQKESCFEGSILILE
jgi:hypothetical protein